jgi:hypothetical protein
MVDSDTQAELAESIGADLVYRREAHSSDRGLAAVALLVVLLSARDERGDPAREPRPGGADDAPSEEALLHGQRGVLVKESLRLG